MASGTQPASSGPSAAMLQNATLDRAERSEFNNSGRDLFKFVLNNYNNVTREDEDVRHESPDALSHISKIILLALEEISKNDQARSTVSESTNAIASDPSPQAVAPDNILEGDPVVVTDMVPPEPFSLPVASMADRYTRCMLKCLAGFPLYEPEPFSERSEEYLRHGVNVGDVGFVRGDGVFDFLFNVCPPKNRLINPSRLPDGFSLEQSECSETRAMRPVPCDTYFFQNPVIRTKSGEYICEGPEGAILELPDGAIRDDATNKRPFVKLAARHGVQWYEYTMSRGRDVSNGALYLITSYTKCAQWGIAVFDRPCTPGQGLKFEKKRSLPFGRSSPKYHWKGSRVFPTKVSDSDKGDTKNQCIFLRGYKIMIRQDLFDKLYNDQPHVLDPAMTSSSSQIGSSSMTRQRATRIRGGGGPDPELKIPADIDPLSRKSGEVILQANFNSSLVHPSDLVNSALLSQNMNAKVALTHDDLWCDLLRDNFPDIKPDMLINIARSYTTTVDEYDCVSLTKYVIPSRISRSSNVIGGSRPLPAIRNPTLRGRLATPRGDDTHHRGNPYRGGSPGRYGSGFRRDGRGRGRGYSRDHSHNQRGDFGRGRGHPSHPKEPLIYPHNEPPTLPPRLNDDVQEQLVSGFRRVGYRAERPLRPGFGKLGTPIKLRANFFAVKLPKGPYYDYAVIITENFASNATVGQGAKGWDGSSNIESPIKKRIFELLEVQPAFRLYIPFVTHDFSQRLIAAKQLPEHLKIPITFIEEDETQPRNGAKVYNVSVKFLNEIDLNVLRQYTEANLQYRDDNMRPIISALNLVLQHHAKHTGVRVGENSRGKCKLFFQQNRRQLAPASEIWQGYFISVRPVFKQLMVNVNVCYTAFIEPGNLANALLKIGGITHGAMPTLPPSIANSIRVKTKHLNYRKKLHKIGTTTARNTFFKCREYGDIDVSVEQYFQRKYDIKLKYPTDLPVVSLGIIDRNGTKTDNWVPAELCDIVVGLPRRHLSYIETSNIVRFSRNPPSISARDIVETGLLKLGFTTPDNLSVLNSFGIEIENKMSSIPARVLPPPRLVYREGRYDMSDGAWNISNIKFQCGAQVRPWWVLYVNDHTRTLQQNDIRPLINVFMDKCRRCGMIISKDMPILLPLASLNKIRNDDSARTSALRLIQDILTEKLREKGKPSFVLVLLETVEEFIYPGIKRIGDVVLGIHTVHMQLNKMLRARDQYFSNVVLKVNAKLGGINHQLQDQNMGWLRERPTMMVGIDLSHAGPGSRAGTPSIAAVVANTDDSFVHFPCSLGIQDYDAKTDNKEMVDNLCDMFVERIKAYEARNKTFPERIFVFRAGVSEGQFPVLLKEEYQKMLKAFEKLSTKSKYRPLLSIVVCGKRRHAIFLPTDAQLADKNGNTKPGTVVDKGVSSVFDYDFYLQSHACCQGTVRSTHYTVLYDENCLDPDAIQKVIYHTSYLYACATRSVSVITPAYYADLACKRGRCYLNKFLNAEHYNTPTSGKSDIADIGQERQRVYKEVKAYWGEGVHSDIKDTMFYL